MYAFWVSPPMEFWERKKYIEEDVKVKFEKEVRKKMKEGREVRKV